MKTTNSVFPTREAYLTEASNLILDDLLMPLAEKYGNGQEAPKFRISVGFPKHSRGGKAIAVCFVKEASSDGVNEIFINPEIDSPLEVLGSVVHELIHAIDNCESGHQNFFAKMARAVGLEGPLTKTVPGLDLQLTLMGYIDLLGGFPHNRMVTDRVHKKDSTRQIKVCCSDTQVCGFMFRTSRRQIEKLHDSTCPACYSHTLVVQDGSRD